jgi:hypothetical protein
MKAVKNRLTAWPRPSAASSKNSGDAHEAAPTTTVTGRASAAPAEAGKATKRPAEQESVKSRKFCLTAVRIKKLAARRAPHLVRSTKLLDWPGATRPQRCKGPRTEWLSQSSPLLRRGIGRRWAGVAPCRTAAPVGSIDRATKNGGSSTIRIWRGEKAKFGAFAVRARDPALTVQNEIGRPPSNTVFYTDVAARARKQNLVSHPTVCVLCDRPAPRPALHCLWRPLSGPSANCVR